MVRTQAYYCTVCRKYTQVFSQACQASGHTQVMRPVKAYQFACGGCGRSLSTITKRFAELRCSFCGAAALGPPDGLTTPGRQRP